MLNFYLYRAEIPSMKISESESKVIESPLETKEAETRTLEAEALIAEGPPTPPLQAEPLIPEGSPLEAESKSVLDPKEVREVVEKAAKREESSIFLRPHGRDELEKLLKAKDFDTLVPGAEFDKVADDIQRAIERRGERIRDIFGHVKSTALEKFNPIYQRMNVLHAESTILRNYDRITEKMQTSLEGYTSKSTVKELIDLWKEVPKGARPTLSELFRAIVRGSLWNLDLARGKKPYISMNDENSPGRIEELIFETFKKKEEQDLYQEIFDAEKSRQSLARGGGTLDVRGREERWQGLKGKAVLGGLAAAGVAAYGLGALAVTRESSVTSVATLPPKLSTFNASSFNPTNWDVPEFKIDVGPIPAFQPGSTVLNNPQVRNETLWMNAAWMIERKVEELGFANAAKLAEDYKTSLERDPHVYRKWLNAAKGVGEYASYIAWWIPGGTSYLKDKMEWIDSSIENTQKFLPAFESLFNSVTGHIDWRKGLYWYLQAGGLQFQKAVRDKTVRLLMPVLNLAASERNRMFLQGKTGARSEFSQIVEDMINSSNPKTKKWGLEIKDFMEQFKQVQSGDIDILTNELYQSAMLESSDDPVSKMIHFVGTYMVQPEYQELAKDIVGDRSLFTTRGLFEIVTRWSGKDWQGTKEKMAKFFAKLDTPEGRLDLMQAADYWFSGDEEVLKVVARLISRWVEDRDVLGFVDSMIKLKSRVVGARLIQTFTEQPLNAPYGSRHELSLLYQGITEV